MSCKMDQTTPICYLYLYFPSHYNIIFKKSQAIWAKKFLKRKELDRKMSRTWAPRHELSLKLPRYEIFWVNSLTKHIIKKPLFSSIWFSGPDFEVRREFNRSKSLIILYNYRLAYDYFLVNLLWNSVQILCQKRARDFLYYILLLSSKFIVNYTDNDGFLI